VRGDIDPATGMVVNLKDLDRVLREVTIPLDHHFLNTDVPEFETVVPTTENIAAYCFKQIQERLVQPGLKLDKVRLLEGSELWVEVENQLPAGQE
jgi:6-pyruvoyltetrahydropterin/6-carboxytetrahydropterin synthase